MEDQHLARIEAKLDKVQDLVFQIAQSAAAQKANLAAVTKRVSEVETELKPLKRHVAMWSGAAKVLVVVSALTGIAAGIVQILQ